MDGQVEDAPDGNEDADEQDKEQLDEEMGDLDQEKIIHRERFRLLALTSSRVQVPEY